MRELSLKSLTIGLGPRLSYSYSQKHKVLVSHQSQDKILILCHENLELYVQYAISSVLYIICALDVYKTIP